MRIEDIAGQLWPGEPVAVEPLAGGITNQNFTVIAHGDRFVVRLGGRDTELLGIDRRAEDAALRLAQSVGVGPDVVAVVPGEGVLVTRFIAGRPISAEEMRTERTIAWVAEAVRAIHSGDAIPGTFSPFRRVESYAATAEDRGVGLPDRYGWAAGVASGIERALGPRPSVPCHNDLLNANFIHDGRRLRIVDWEYAAMGDPMFDLANFASKHGFGPEHEETLLTAYLGAVRREDLAALRLMRFMANFWEAMWGVVQQGISELDFDFHGYAREFFGRLEAIEANPGFEDWIRLAPLASPQSSIS